MVSAQPAAAARSVPRTERRTAAFSVLTWNIDQWPTLFSARRNRHRLDQVRGAIGPFDVVCLQECWSSAAREIRRAFPEYYVDDGRSVFGFGSGLLTLSRFPVLDGYYHRYEHAAFPDSWAAKGMTLVRLWVPGFGPLQVVNTHLQAWRADGVRIEQIRELAAFIGTHAGGLPTLLAGDLNAAPGSDEMECLRRIVDLRDLLAERPLAPPSALEAGTGRHRFDGADERIDHLQILEGRASAEVLETGSLDEPGEGPASDHTGLFVRLRLERWG